MIVRDIATGEDLEAIIVPVEAKDFAIIARDKKRFGFDWKDYKKQEVYKLCLRNDDTILGLMGLTSHTDPGINAIEINLLESAAEHIGPDKKIDFIGGCLIAFACRESFKRGHEGFVFLVPKTDLIEHYPAKYGFTHFPMRTAERPEGIMTLSDSVSRKLIKKYLE